MRHLLDEVSGVLGSERAALKLLVNNKGLAVDDVALARAVPGYPEAFRTKRARKRPAVISGRFVDTDTADHPFIPTELRFEVDGQPSVVKVNYAPDSPFRLELRDEGLALRLAGTDLALAAELLPRTAAGDRLIAGHRGDEYVQVIGADRIGILAYTGCENWFRRNQCRFCDSCASRPGEEDAKPDLNDLQTRFGGDVDLWWNTVGPGFIDGVRLAFAQTLADPAVGPHHHVHLMAGNLLKVDAEWRLVLEIGAALASVRPLEQVDSYINLIPPPDPVWLERARALGFRKAVFNLEVFGAMPFRAVCPGKNQLMPYPTYLERMDQAVQVFGAGNVYCGFVFGAQPFAEVEAGVRHLAKRGIVADYSSFTPKEGTPWVDRPRPEVIDTARFVALLVAVHRENGFRPSCCALSLRSSAVHEALGT